MMDALIATPTARARNRTAADVVLQSKVSVPRWLVGRVDIGMESRAFLMELVSLAVISFPPRLKMTLTA